MMDIVTVFHNETNKREAEELEKMVVPFPDVQAFYAVDNTEINRGFAKACNLGASFGSAPIVGFLNPDTKILGDFCGPVIDQIQSGVTITGERFGKPDRELKIWGCHDWVCGAALFVERKWFESVGGFDERFVWSWEETALIRLAQEHGRKVKSIKLPIHHESPDNNSPEDAAYKNKWFDHGSKLFYKRFPVPTTRRPPVRGRR